MAFDISSVLKAAPEGREQIVYLDLDLLDQDPDNFYSLEGLDELAGNIELIGLQQPIRVRRGERGRYVIVSGHRRRAACMMIRDGGSDQFADGVPCIIERGEDSPAMRELRMIYANASTRVLSAADLSKQAERVEALLYQLKEEGTDFPGRMRDHVAEACKVSKTKLARLHAIRKNLNPGLLAEFDAGRINESVAYRISQEEPDVQKKLADRTGPSIRDYDINRVENAIATVKSPRQNETVKFDGHGHLAYDASEYLENLHREDEEYARMLNTQATALIRKMHTVKSRQDGIEQLKNAHWKIHHGWSTEDGFANSSLKGLTLEDWNNKDLKITRSWTEVYDLLCVYLMNRAPEILAPKVSGSNTKAEWSTGTPAEAGEYVIRCGVPAEEKAGSMIKSIKEWNGEAWTDSKGVPLRLNVYGWIRLPEV